MSSRSMSCHVSATSSDLRRPVLPASITIARSRRSNSARRDASSTGESISGSRSRLAEVLTFVIGLRSIHSCRIAWLNTADMMLRILLRVPGAKVRECSHNSTSTVCTLHFVCHQPTATRRVVGFVHPTSAEYPPASSYGNAYCCPLMALAWKNCA
jgi:hypothetical protein